MTLAETSAQPLDPQVLRELDILHPLPDMADFEAESSYTHHYLFWTVVARTRANPMVRITGSLRLERTRARHDDGRFALAARQDVLLEESNLYGGRSIVEVEALCRTDALASPLRWSLESRFTHQGKGREDLTLRESGRVEEHMLHHRIGKTESSTPLERSFTTDWCLFEALGRFGERPFSESFDLLDGFHTLKPRHALQRRADLDQSAAPDEPPLRCVTQLGQGRLPVEYWLDPRGRLLAAVSGTRVCVLEPDALRLLAEREASWIYVDPATQGAR